MGLLETYPNLKDKIVRSRNAGYSDEEIQQLIKTKVQESLDKGYSSEEVGQFLGVAKKEVPSAKRFIYGDVQGVKPRAAEILPEEAKESIQDIKKAFTGKTIVPSWLPGPAGVERGVRAGIGAMRLLWSPVTAATRAVIGEPSIELALKLGASEPLAKGIGTGAEIAAQMLIPSPKAGAIIKGAKELLGVKTIATEAQVATKAIPTVKKGLEQILPGVKFSAIGKKAEEAKKVLKTFMEGDAELEALYSSSVRGAYEKAKRLLVDASANIKDKLLKEGGEYGKEAVITHDLIKGAGANASRIVQEVSNDIYKGLDKGEEKLLNMVIEARRSIAISGYKKGVTHRGGHTPQEFQSFLDSIPSSTLTKLDESANKYFGVMKQQLNDLYKEGVISKESLKNLGQYIYSPRLFIQHIDPEDVSQSFSLGGKKISVGESGIRKLEEGSERALENNSRLLLAHVVQSTQGRIARNKANMALYSLAKTVPENGIVRTAKIVSGGKVSELKVGSKVIARDRNNIGKVMQVTDNTVTINFYNKETGLSATKTFPKSVAKTEVQGFSSTFENTPAGFEKIMVMHKGNPVPMFMPSKLAKEWITYDPQISHQLATWAGWLSGSKVLKPLATGINPEFAITNLPRDIAHVWLTTHEFSKHLPVAAGQMAVDFTKTFLDSVRRRGSWTKYMEEGGGMSFLTTQGRMTSRKGGIFGHIQDALSYVGETSEVWTRLALRNRALRNGKSSTEATWIARNYLDFAQGGSAVKAVDTAVPYLNASVQATRGIFRAASQKPGEFTYKIAQLGTLATGLYLANKYGNPECWKHVPDRDKVNNWIITTPLTYKDKGGNTIPVYFKIPKDQGQRILATMFENVMAKFLGEEVNGSQIVQAVQDFLPIIPTEKLPPTLDAMLGYALNKDFWRNEDIWKGPNIKERNQYTRYTHPAFVEVGEVTGLSPEKMRYSLQKVFTGSNIYTDLVGGGLSAILKELPEVQREKATLEIIKGLPFARRMTGFGDPYAPYRKKTKELKLEASDRAYTQGRDLDILIDKHYSKEDVGSLGPVKEYINTQPPEDRSRLRQRMQRMVKLADIPNRSWWVDLSAMTPQARALAFWARYSSSTEKEQTELTEQLPRAPGVRTTDFIRYFNLLKQKESTNIKEK